MGDTEWWRGAVIYQIYPRSFSDSNGDGIGDLPGIIEKLGYIAELGVDAIWVCPFFRSPMRDFGYDIADFRAVDPIFGALADFDRLIARAHALGLKVLIDQVWSHSSDRHPWFRESRAGRGGERADWYVWADPKPDGTPPNNWLSVFGGSAWNWEPRRRQYYLHHFLPSQPQLNLRNPAVVAALVETGEFWLDRGADGFRLDALDFLLHDPALRDNPPCPFEGLPPAKPFGLQHHLHDMLHPDAERVIERIRSLVDRYPGAVTLGEVSSQPGALERIAAYTAGGERLHMAYTLRVSREPFVTGSVRRMIDELAALDPRAWTAWSFSNHDVERAVTRWGGPTDNPALARLLIGFLLSLRGSICLYQGEELGLPQSRLDIADIRDPFGLAFYPEYPGRDGSRTPMPWRAAEPNAGFTTAEKPWLPVDPSHYALSVDGQQADRNSMLNFCRRLLSWRKAHPALIRGNIAAIDTPDPVVAFRRHCAAESLVVAHNLSEAPAPLPEGLSADVTPLEGHGFALLWRDRRPALPPYGMFFGAVTGRGGR
jgi:alpha-glucosidase